MSLPIYKDQNQNLMLLETNWAKILNPIISNPSLQSILLQNISLASGANVINHKLGRKLQGWKIVRQRASASVYDTQDTNIHPDLTLFLTSSGIVSVDLEVF